MNREELLNNICPTSATRSCYDRGARCEECNGCLNEWLNEYEREVREKLFKEIEDALSEIYNADLYCKEDYCKSATAGYKCDDCLYATIYQRLRRMRKDKNV